MLDAEAHASGASRSELIRRAIRERYGGERRRPRSIGSMSSGHVDAANDEELLRAEFDRQRPPRRSPAV